MVKPVGFSIYDDIDALFCHLHGYTAVKNFIIKFSLVYIFRYGDR